MRRTRPCRDPRFSIGLDGLPEVDAGRGAEDDEHGDAADEEFSDHEGVQGSQVTGRGSAPTRCASSLAAPPRPGALSSSSRVHWGVPGRITMPLPERVAHEGGDPLLAARPTSAAWLRRADRPSARTRENSPKSWSTSRKSPSASRWVRKGAAGSAVKGSVRSPNRSSGRGGLGSRRSSPTVATVRRRLSAPKEATFSPFSSTSENSASRTRRGSQVAVPATATPGALPRAGPSRRASDRSVVRS